jgi:predicted DNA-binding ribbon-helix-helix protein
MIQRPELSFEKMKRSIVIAGHKTSLSLEAAFWLSLKEIAALEGTPVSQLVNRIDTDRENANLSSAIRLYVLNHYRLLAEAKSNAKNAH